MKIACTDCDYSTDDKGKFKYHCVTYPGVKAHNCDTCGNSFTLKINLTQHIKSDHNKKSKWECEICEKVFNNRGSLLQHVKAVHDQIKSFACTECDKIFTQNIGLTRHMRIHTKENRLNVYFVTNCLQVHQISQAMKLEFTPKTFLRFVKSAKRGFFDLTSLLSM